MTSHVAPTAGYRILSAAAGDIDDLHALVRALAAYERLSDLCTSTPADLAAALFGPRPVAEALIVRLDGNSQVAAGFALFFHTYSTFLGRPSLWLEDLFVRPDHRGRGIGRAMIRALAALAVERGCGRFEWAVLDWNEPAIGFYKSLGAQPQHEWTVFRLVGDALEKLARTAD